MKKSKTPKRSAAKKVVKKIITTPLSENERVLLAAVFARTNMGQSAPAKDTIRRMMSSAEQYGTNLDSAISSICADIMESDEHYKMFMQEAKGWYKEFKKTSREYVITTWPENAELFWEPPMWDTSSIYAMERTAQNHDDGLCATRIRGHWLEVETKDGKKFTYKFGLNKLASRREAMQILASKR